MKQLFWKEWYELRLLPLGSALCVALLIFGAKVLSTVEVMGANFQLPDTFLPLVGTWAICALLAGSGLFAQEVGSGGLQFLSALPTSRRRLWGVKVSTALGMLLVSVLCSTLTWMVIDAFVFRNAFFDFFYANRHGPTLVQVAAALLLLLSFFSVSLAVSPFLDRSLSAVVTALLVGIAYFGALETLAFDYVNYYGRLYDWQSDAHRRSQDWLFALLSGLSLLVFVTVSYWTFTRGESLRSSRRFQVGALAGLASVAVAVLVFVAGNQTSLW